MEHRRAIKVLEPDVAKKIAAGEVIERPASVVKELIENAIDAGATDIRIEVRGGGLDLIRVTDNGWGMSPAEVELCLQRHATSKIDGADDLTRITTLGFRGEALPSIAAVARVHILTRRPDDRAGAFVITEGGNIIDRGSQGCASGTVITVYDLFQNLPARLKYMKSPATEFAQIGYLVSQFALAYPELRFSLINNGRTAFQSTGDGDLFSVLVKVYGVTTAEAMCRIGFDDNARSNVRVSGYTSGPGISRSNRQGLSFFVNRRWVQSRLLSFAVEDAYGPILADGRHPIAVVNIALPPDEVDVNVHPSKTEVRFLRDREVFVAVQTAIKRTLYENSSLEALIERGDALLPSLEKRLEIVANPPRPAATPLPQVGIDLNTEATIDSATAQQEGCAGGRLRIIGQMANTFIIAEGPDGMYLIDQHRAHERILFDRLVSEQKGEGCSTQLLLEPLVVELSGNRVEALESRQEDLLRVGFLIERFGEQSFIVRAVPAALGNTGALESAAQIVEKAANDAEGDWLEGMLVEVACKGAIKAGQALSVMEMRELLLRLEQSSLASICPHGAPIIVHLSQAQLERQFRR